MPMFGGGGSYIFFYQQNWLYYACRSILYLALTDLYPVLRQDVVLLLHAGYLGHVVPDGVLAELRNAERRLVRAGHVTNLCIILLFGGRGGASLYQGPAKKTRGAVFCSTVFTNSSTVRSLKGGHLQYVDII